MKAALEKDWNQFTNTNTKPLELSVDRYHEAPDNKKEELLDAVKTLVRNATPIMQETRQMLQDWEASEESVMNLWRKMNGWVYAGFEVTYKSLGSILIKLTTNLILIY
jgi:arginyl-tRNA synthetase